MKVCEFRGRSHKTVLLSAVSTFPPIKPRIQPNRVAGWFNTFDINNWHSSSRKVKIVTKEGAGEKILECWLAEKEGAFFRQGVLRKMYGKRAMKKKKSEKG